MKLKIEIVAENKEILAQLVEIVKIKMLEYDGAGEGTGSGYWQFSVEKSE